ncbi:MAG: FCD domain-containing protein, partial [Myxococcota bacterium]|jgi:DNA-binding FadR family transcriptional regulator|nr:FCD domain-containing protein [Myxococcota bacterium]
VVEGLLRDPAFVTRDLLDQLLVFRRQVTLSVVELAARNRNDEQLARARRLLEQEAAEGVDPARALEIDLLWNALLGEATHNLLYQLVTNLFTKLVARLGPLYYNAERDPQRSMTNHRDLLAAIEARDSEAACRIVGDMLRYSEDRIREAGERLESAGVIRATAPRAAGGSGA